jgi:hypothetical protein
VKVLDELRVAPASVVDHRVVVVRHCARQEHLDPVPLRGLDQAVGERVVRIPIGPQQELPLRAPAGDQVELARQDRTRRHADLAIKILASPLRRDLARLELEVAGCRPSMSESRTGRGHGWGHRPRCERSKINPGWVATYHRAAIGDHLALGAGRYLVSR